MRLTRQLRGKQYGVNQLSQHPQNPRPRRKPAQVTGARRDDDLASVRTLIFQNQRWQWISQWISSQVSWSQLINLLCLERYPLLPYVCFHVVPRTRELMRCRPALARRQAEPLEAWCFAFAVANCFKSLRYTILDQENIRTIHYDSFIIHSYFHLKALKLVFFLHEGGLLFMVMQNDHLHTLKTTFIGTFEGQRWWVHLRGAGHLVLDWSNWRSPVMDLQFVISTRCLRLLHFFFVIVFFFFRSIMAKEMWKLGQRSWPHHIADFWWMAAVKKRWKTKIWVVGYCNWRLRWTAGCYHQG